MEKILCKPVIQMKDDAIVEEYGSVKDASEKTGIVKQNISSALRGKYRSAGGFKWMYKNETDRLQGHLKAEFKMPKHSKSTRLKMSISAKKKTFKEVLEYYEANFIKSPDVHNLLIELTKREEAGLKPLFKHRSN